MFDAPFASRSDLDEILDSRLGEGIRLSAPAFPLPRAVAHCSTSNPPSIGSGVTSGCSTTRLSPGRANTAGR